MTLNVNLLVIFNKENLLINKENKLFLILDYNTKDKKYKN